MRIFSLIVGLTDEELDAINDVMEIVRECWCKRGPEGAQGGQRE